MPIRIPYQARGYTYVQEEPPTNPQPGDTWFKPSQGLGFVWNERYGVWDKISDSQPWGPGSDYAYHCAGLTYDPDTATSGAVSTIQRFQFSVEGSNAQVVGYTPRENEGHCGHNSSVAGFVKVATTCVAGSQPTENRLAKFDFPLDAGDATDYLTITRDYDVRVFTATNSSEHGYTMGGIPYDPATCASVAPYNSSTIDRHAFATPGTAIVVGSLAGGVSYAVAVNATEAGYVAAVVGAGGDGADGSGLNRLLFPFDSGTAAQVDAVLPVASRLFASFNSTLFGYVGMGVDSAAGWPAGLTTLNRFQFPLDAAGAVHQVGFSAHGLTSVGGTNSTRAGYFSGGANNDPQAKTHHTFIERFAFPFDSGVGFVERYLAVPCRSHDGGVDGVDFVSQFVSPA